MKMRADQFEQSFIKTLSRFSAMLDASKAPPRKKKKATGLQALGIAFFVVVLCSLGLVVKYSWSGSAPLAPEIAMDVKEYDALLVRAKVLTAKYKELSAGTASAQEAPPSPKGSQSGQTPVSNLRAISSSVGKTVDLVLGMAQDTDPKNLVRKFQFFRSRRHALIQDIFLHIIFPLTGCFLPVAEEVRLCFTI